MTYSNDKPINGQQVLVQLDTKEFAIAIYSSTWGFEADDSGYDIDIDDASGLNVTLEGKVIHWWPLPTEGVL